MKKKHSKVSFMYAIFVHIAVFVLLCVSLRFDAPVMQPKAQLEKVIQAVAVDQAEVQKEVAKIKRQENIKHHAEIARQRYLKQLAEQAEARRKEAEEQRKQAEQMASQVEARRKQAEQMANQVEAQRKKAEQELQQLKLHQKELEEQQLLKQQAEAKKLAEMKKQQALEQQRLMELKKRTQEAAKKQKMIEEAQKKMLAEQLAEEQKRLDRLHDQQMQSEIVKYKGLILNAIGQHWIIPSHVDKNLSTQLSIRLAPSGVVLSVKMVKSSGDAVLDRSAINAVWKTSPLPVPKDSRLFEKFRELHLTVKPESVV